jgi:hypothetical protein
MTSESRDVRLEVCPTCGVSFTAYTTTRARHEKTPFHRSAQARIDEARAPLRAIIGEQQRLIEWIHRELVTGADLSQREKRILARLAKLMRVSGRG